MTQPARRVVARWGTVSARASIIVRAPADVVRAVYADYASWPEFFTTISAVRLLRRRGPTVVVEVDHVEGKVVNELTFTPRGELELREFKRRYDGLFVNRFDPIPQGTRVTVRARLTLKGRARAVGPIVGWYARRQVRRLQLEPLKSRAEEFAAGRTW